MNVGQDGGRNGGTSPARLWRRSALVWLALTVLLAATLFGAHLPIGGWKLPLALTIAAAKAGLVVAIFMGLGQAIAAARVAALCGLLWVMLLLSLSMTDQTTRQRIAPGFSVEHEAQP